MQSFLNCASDKVLLDTAAESNLTGSRFFPRTWRNLISATPKQFHLWSILERTKINPGRSSMKNEDHFSSGSWKSLACVDYYMGVVLRKRPLLTRLKACLTVTRYAIWCTSACIKIQFGVLPHAAIESYFLSHARCYGDRIYAVDHLTDRAQTKSPRAIENSSKI